MSQYIEEDKDPGETTRAILAIVSITLLVLLVFLFVTYKIAENARERPLKQACEENPRLRYAPTCTTEEDCIEKCIEERKHEQ